MALSSIGICRFNKVKNYFSKLYTSLIFLWQEEREVAGMKDALWTELCLLKVMENTQKMYPLNA